MGGWVVEQDETGKWQNQISAHLDEIVELQRLLLFLQVFWGGVGQVCLDVPNP